MMVVPEIAREVRHKWLPSEAGYERTIRQLSRSVNAARHIGVGVILLLALLLPAAAAPTCLDKSGQTIRCATPGAMPVGWKASPEVAWAYKLAHPGPGGRTVLEVVLFIALFLAMIALLPRFDGSKPEDWDRQEDDDPPPPP